jgi:guanylate kinase
MAHEFANYQQSDEIVQRMQDVPLIAVVGPSRAGKTTLMEYARARDVGLHFVVSDTSRPSRPNETDGVHYYFQTKETMEGRARVGSYATVAPSITGDLYATSPDEYDQYGRPIMAVLSSVIPAFRSLFPTMCTVVVLPPDFEAWMGRGEDRNNQAKRMTEAVESLQFAASDDHSIYIINDDLEAAQAEFMGIVRGEMPSRTKAGQQLAQQLLSQVQAL